jgi:glycosyltransferase involved in cell wall biosynthesis
LSVVNQSHNNIQVIVADDGSTDESPREIQKLKTEFPRLEIHLGTTNVGNCKAFNAALKFATGDFIIDFATDDVMLPDRIEKQVRHFTSCDPSVGVVFSDAVYIDESGKFLRNHFEYLLQKRLIKRVPEGDVYGEVLATYFIPGPTMMVRREVYQALRGYDEDLTYEDFDFWIRSAREFQYAYLREKLTQIRKVKQSMSSGWYVPGDKQLHSTYLVCRKAQRLNRTRADEQALIQRVRYEFRQSVVSQNFPEAADFFGMLRELEGVRTLDKILWLVNQYRIPMARWRQLYHRIRFS